MTKSEIRIHKALLLAKKRAKFKRQRKKIAKARERLRLKEKRHLDQISRIKNQAENLYQKLDAMNAAMIRDFKHRAKNYNKKYKK